MRDVNKGNPQLWSIASRKPKMRVTIECIKEQSQKVNKLYFYLCLPKLSLELMDGIY